MGDPKRFAMFSRLIAERHSDRSLRIADVASGKGQLQAALRQLGFSNVESWDKRKRNATARRNYRYGWFDYRHAPRGYELVVAMHPDQGTDHAISYACKHRVPFVVCPCCVMPSAIEYGGLEGSYTDWKRHLVGFARSQRMVVEDVPIPITGRSSVLLGRPE